MCVKTLIHTAGGGKMGNFIRRLSSSQIIILGFAAAILLGCLLLMLPFATVDGQGAPFSDALFTATSAVCVTGLVVHDTATYWSLFGKLVLITLIQIGGMGVITIAVALYSISGKRVSLKQRSTMVESISGQRLEGIVGLTGFIVKMTLVFELLGALLLSPVFIQRFGPVRGICYSLFHAISAFCNAGFDLMGINGAYSSLTAFAGQPWVNVVLMALIIIGGIGFLVWDDVRCNKLHFKRYQLQSKVAIVASALLILLPAVYFFFFEYSDAPLGTRLLTSLFQSVTARTAGFNSTDLTLFSQSGIFLMIMLMLVGGSPGSTAGGMKTTTLAVLLANALCVFRHRDHARFFGRRVPEETVRSAATILTMYICLFVLGAMIISRVEALPLLTCLFETGSAIGTVGLTLGITPSLGQFSRAILIILMYMGRVGGLTLIFATTTPGLNSSARYPLGKLTVG